MNLFSSNGCSCSQIFCKQSEMIIQLLHFQNVCQRFSIDCNFNSSGSWTSNNFSELSSQIRHSEFTHSNYDITGYKVNKILRKNVEYFSASAIGLISCFKVFAITSESDNRRYPYMFYRTNKSLVIRFVKVIC